MALKRPNPAIGGGGVRGVCDRRTAKSHPLNIDHPSPKSQSAGRADAAPVDAVAVVAKNSHAKYCAVVVRGSHGRRQGVIELWERADESGAMRRTATLPAQLESIPDLIHALIDLRNELLREASNGRG